MGLLSWCHCTLCSQHIVGSLVNCRCSAAVLSMQTYCFFWFFFISFVLFLPIFCVLLVQLLYFVVLFPSFISYWRRKHQLETLAEECPLNILRAVPGGAKIYPIGCGESRDSWWHRRKSPIQPLIPHRYSSIGLKLFSGGLLWVAKSFSVQLFPFFFWGKTWHEMLLRRCLHADKLFLSR